MFFKILKIWLPDCCWNHIYDLRFLRVIWGSNVESTCTNIFHTHRNFTNWYVISGSNLLFHGSDCWRRNTLCYWTSTFNFWNRFSNMIKIILEMKNFFVTQFAMLFLFVCVFAVLCTREVWVVVRFSFEKMFY